MATSTEHVKWKKNFNRWISDNRKWKKAQKKVSQALRSLELVVKKHNNETKAFEKRAKASKSMMANGKHSTSLHKRLKKTNQQHSQCYAEYAKARKNILKVTKAIQNTVRGIH